MAAIKISTSPAQAGSLLRTSKPLPGRSPKLQINTRSKSAAPARRHERTAVRQQAAQIHEYSSGQAGPLRQVLAPAADRVRRAESFWGQGPASKNHLANALCRAYPPRGWACGWMAPIPRTDGPLSMAAGAQPNTCSRVSVPRGQGHCCWGLHMAQSPWKPQLGFCAAPTCSNACLCAYRQPVHRVRDPKTPREPPSTVQSCKNANRHHCPKQKRGAWQNSER